MVVKDVCRGTHHVLDCAPSQHQPPSAPKELLAVSSQEPVGCDLVSGQWPGAWAGGMVSSATHLPSQVGRSPRPLLGHAAQCTERAVCWGRKRIPRRPKVSCFTYNDPGPGKDPNTGAARTAMPGPAGSRDLHSVRLQCLGDLREPVVGLASASPWGAASACPPRSTLVCCHHSLPVMIPAPWHCLWMRHPRGR